MDKYRLNSTNGEMDKCARMMAHEDDDLDLEKFLSKYGIKL